MFGGISDSPQAGIKVDVQVPDASLGRSLKPHRFSPERQMCWCSLGSRHLFAYDADMFQMPGNRKTFVVKCKRCRRDLPSGREEFPFQSITVECPLCDELRRYLPSEVFLGRPDQLVVQQQRAAGR
jgi:hypothetical protein